MTTIGRKQPCFRSVLIPAAAILLLVAAGLNAQQVTGRILGAVFDPAGSAVANAQIVVTNQDTGAVRNITSGPDGLYNAPQLAAGTYTIEVTVTGFDQSKYTGVVVNVGTDTRLDVRMKVGSVQQTVSVSTTAPLVDTTSSSVGGIVEEQKVADLPLNGRNWNDLTLLQPGVTQAQIYVGNPTQPGANGNIYSSNGGTLRSNFYSLDGANMLTLTGFNSSSMTNSSLGVDGIREYTVVTSMFSAEYGMRMGSQTTVVTKSGTNQFHGDAFEYIRNASLDARNYFDVLDTSNVNGFGTNKSTVFPGKRLPPFHRNNFGGAFGGPIKHDKTFFYAVYEGIRQRQAQTIIERTFPQACFVDQNNVTQPNVPAKINNSASNPFSNGVSGACAGTSAGATVTVNSFILPLADLFPSPNVVGAPTFNFTYPYVQPTTEDYGQIRVDQNFSAADTAFLRYTQDKGDSLVGLTYPHYFRTLASASHLATLAENHVFSPTLLNTVRFSYSRSVGVTDSYVSPSSLNAPNVVLVPGNPTGIGNIGPGGGVTALGTQTTPATAVQDIFTLSDDVFWTKGKHAFKFGTLMNRYLMYPNEHDFFAGTVSFGSLANFFNAVYSGITVETPNSQTAYAFSMNTFGFYVQDDYRATSRLTLNLGFRYEFNTVPTERNPAFALAVRNSLTDTAATPGNLFLNSSLHNFSPRVGFAWDVTGKGTTSVRGGAGIYYDIGAVGDILLVTAISNPPISVNYQLNNTLPSPAIPFTVPIPIAFNVPLSPRQAEYNMQQPTMSQYNLTVQQQLPWGMALSVGYIGSRGWHIYQLREGNPTLPAGIGANGLPFYGCWNSPPVTTPPTPPTFVLPSSNGSCPSAFSSVPPRANPAWGIFQVSQARGDSWYNSLQLQLNKRVTRGLQFQFSYTRAKLLDTGQGQFSSEGVTEVNQFPNGISERFDRGPASFDAANNIRVNLIYHAPGIKSEGVMSKLLNGWWFSSIVAAQSGYPFTALLGSDRALQASSYTSLRPNLDPSFNSATVITRNPNSWFNPTMFDLQPVGTFGNEARNSLRGPGFENVDFSIVKDTKAGFLGEAGTVEFRTEMFNILNHPNLALPATTVWTSGAPTAALAGQIGTNVVPAFATAGQITTTASNSRQIQFALKVIF